MKERIAFPIRIMFPLDVEKGETGLFYVTSPMVRGLLVARDTRHQAINDAEQALEALAKAYMGPQP